MTKRLLICISFLAATFLSSATMADGTSVEAVSEVGAAQYADAEEHLPENLSDDPLEVVLIELKD